VRLSMASLPAQLQILQRGGALWVITGSASANFAQPDSIGTALIAALAGGMQAGFYAWCGGFALDLTGARNPIRALGSSVIAAIALWTIA
jgi:hypothetical protein